MISWFLFKTPYVPAFKTPIVSMLMCSFATNLYLSLPEWYRVPFRSARARYISFTKARSIGHASDVMDACSGSASVRLHLFSQNLPPLGYCIIDNTAVLCHVMYIKGRQLLLSICQLQDSLNIAIYLMADVLI